MNEYTDMTPDDARQYLINWMKKLRAELRDNPEAFQIREPGLYLGGMKLEEGDIIVNDNNGLPCIIRKGCFE